MDPYFFIFVSLCAVVVIQIGYYLFVFSGVFSHKDSSRIPKEAVSVIICTRNNRIGLESNLSYILEQSYHEFEVIVVNDGSTDGTLDYLDNLAKKNEVLRVLHLDIDERFHRGKKFAQTIGIKAAKNDILLFTDTDCRPSSKHWIAAMAAAFGEDTEIVLGLGSHFKKANPLNWLVQMESFHTALLYINFALRKMAYMGVGRNLAYRRSLFFKVKGFASHQHIISGDDDLFVNETATKNNVAVCTHPDGRTYSTITGGLGRWFRQKKRHFSTGKAYQLSDKFRLGVYMFSLLLMYLTFTALLWSPVWWAVALGVLGFRFIIQAIILFKNMSVFGYTSYYLMFPFLDLGMLLVQIFVGIRGYFSKPRTW